MAVNDVGVGLRLRRLARPDVELPVKTKASEFGGGKSRGVYTNGEIARRLCSRAGCGRVAHASWAGCADGQIQRPLCAECDVELNRMVQEWWGDPDWERVITGYANEVQADLDRPLDIDWLVRGDE